MINLLGEGGAKTRPTATSLCSWRRWVCVCGAAQRRGRTLAQRRHRIACVVDTRSCRIPGRIRRYSGCSIIESARTAKRRDSWRRRQAQRARVLWRYARDAQPSSGSVRRTRRSLPACPGSSRAERAERRPRQINGGLARGRVGVPVRGLRRLTDYARKGVALGRDANARGIHRIVLAPCLRHAARERRIERGARGRRRDRRRPRLRGRVI